MKLPLGITTYAFVQVTPLPLYPALQAHVKLPDVFVHVAFVEQLLGFAVHSLTSLHVTPLPLYPALQAQV